jgi:hypothetical protein
MANDAARDLTEMTALFVAAWHTKLRLEASREILLRDLDSDIDKHPLTARQPPTTW